jgi:hypothetical protein
METIKMTNNTEESWVAAGCEMRIALRKKETLQISQIDGEGGSVPSFS